MKLSECWRCSLRTTNVILPTGRQDSQIMVVGDKPNKQEELEGKCFIHTAGSHIKSLLKRAGIENAYFTLAVKCHGDPKSEHVNTCKVWLWKEIQSVQPKVILTLGRLPSTLLLNTKQPLSKLIGVHKVDWTDATIACYYDRHRMLSQGKNKDDEAVKFFSTLKGYY